MIVCGCIGITSCATSTTTEQATATPQATALLPTRQLPTATTIPATVMPEPIDESIDTTDISEFLRPTAVPRATPIPKTCNGWIAFSAQQYDTNENGAIDLFDDAVHIYSKELGSGEPAQLTNGNHRDIHPAWSPDGERIAFISNRSGNFDLFTMNADGSDLRQLTTTVDDETTPAWSPDGSKIAYVLVKNLASGEQERRLYLISPDGNDMQELSAGVEYSSDPDWSPDGRYLLFERRDVIEYQGTRSGKNNVYFWDTFTDSLILLELDSRKFENIFVHNVKWIPRDGYFLSLGTDRLGDDVSGPTKIYEVAWVGF